MRESDEINKAIPKLNYEDVNGNFELIEDQNKVPVFVEFDEYTIMEKIREPNVSRLQKTV
jgi:hypothetical protein